MATGSDCSKICQEDDNTCKKDAHALCFHCTKNLCRSHLLKHAQLVEEMIQSELNLLGDKFNELTLAFDDICISKNILNKPFNDLEKWRMEAHKKIDQMFENKSCEINNKIEEYRKIMKTKNDEQMKKINASKKLVTELIREGDASRKQMEEFQTLINETENYLKSFTTHNINVINSSPICCLSIDTQFFDFQSLLEDELREFKITYVRLNRIIGYYYVKTKKNGTMSDLKNSFVTKYNLLQEINGVELNLKDTSDHQLQLDFILPAEVYMHRVNLQYSEDYKLTTILENDKIVFYETPHSLVAQKIPHILMPCVFRRLSTRQLFALPIYLNVPRNGCQGQDVRKALHDMLGTYFPLDPETNYHLYRAVLVSTKPGESIPNNKVLSDALSDQLDFIGTNTSLEVHIDDEIADIYENNKFKYKIFQ